MIDAMKKALEALEGWDNYGYWVWPETALEQCKRNTKESLSALRQAIEQAEKEATLQEITDIGQWDTSDMAHRSGGLSVEEKSMEPINPHDLIIETYSTDYSGWFTNDRAVKITHVPTGQTASCSSERSQHRNRYKAMAELEQKLRLRTQQTALDGLAETSREIEQEPVAWVLKMGNEKILDSHFNDIQELDDGTPLYTAPPKRQWVSLSDEEFRAIRNSLSRQDGWDGDGWDLALKQAIEAALRSKNT
jgi:hypothetical protein